MQQIHDWIIPQWPAPPRVRACTTTRIGGVSQGVFASMNLGDKSEDNIVAIAKNRNQLSRVLRLPGEPCWLYQSHSNRVVRLYDDTGVNLNADASYTTIADKVCVVLTADCLPVLLCAKDGSAVAAIHAGWRGLANGVLDNTISTLLHFAKCQPGNLIAWLGPAIGPAVFEVGDDVRSAFIKTLPHAAAAFRPVTQGKWLADMYLLARQRLERMGVTEIFGGNFCTAIQYEKFYSYRRDQETGRMATLIWMDGGSSARSPG
ncbi:MAG TPA: peptidoglycan editing factor PgeF [Gammaproteobacteria bacterium]